MLIVADKEVGEDVFRKLLNRYGRPAQITWVSKFPPPANLNMTVKRAKDVSVLDDAGYDDVLYFGWQAKQVEALFPKVGAGGLFNIVLCGGRLGRDVVTFVGRIHYSPIRIVGTTGWDPAESMGYIPPTGEIRAGDKINIIGAGGPMGTMHVIRNICQGVEGVCVFASDVDDSRLDKLTEIAAPLAKKNGVKYKAYNSSREEISEVFDYIALMAPIPDLVAGSVHSAAKGGLINIFAGIPAAVTARIDLDAYIEKQLYFTGTSGSVLEDMKQVLAKVESGRLDTNISVAAVGCLESGAEGIRAVEDRSIAGKIIVYPACKGLGLTRLEELNEKVPEVGRCLINGLWTREAEKKLLAKYQ